MKRNENYILREIAGEYILIATGSVTAQLSGLVSFSETSAFVWEKLAEEQTVEQLVESVTDEYEVDTDVAKNDVVQLIGNLKQLGLLENIA